ncbi:hypothetical protein ACFLQS_00820 [Actinomycetota bacterium]
MKKTNLWLFILYVLLALVVPVVVVFVNLMVRDAYVWGHNWNIAVKYLMLFVTLPIYLIYTFLILKRHFPKKIIKALSLFLPYLLSFAIYYFWEDMGLLDFLVLNSLPFFLGISILYFGGLLVLIIQNTRGEPIREIIKKVIGTIIIIGLIFLPVLHSFLIGIKFNLEKGGLLFLIGFFAVVISTAVSHIPVLKELYEEGKL